MRSQGFRKQNSGSGCCVSAFGRVIGFRASDFGKKSTLGVQAIDRPVSNLATGYSPSLSCAVCPTSNKAGGRTLRGQDGQVCFQWSGGRVALVAGPVPIRGTLRFVSEVPCSPDVPLKGMCGAVSERGTVFATLCSQSRRALVQGRLQWVTSIPDGESFSSLHGDLACCSIRRSSPPARMSKDALQCGHIVLCYQAE